KRLGVTLLARTPDGFATTSAGEAILRQCMAMEHAALDLERVAAGRDSLATGSVRVTTTDALGDQLVVPAIAALRHAHPDLQVDLILGVRSLDIARRDADLAVRFARPASSDLVCRKLGEVGFSLYATRRYLAKSGIPKRGLGLAGYDLITFAGAPAATSPFFMGESLEGARIALRCNNPLIQLKAAANDIGIAELACFLGDTSPDLVRVWPHAQRNTAGSCHHGQKPAAIITVKSRPEDPSFFAVSQALGLHHQTVQRCMERAVAEGPMAALDDRPRPGREPTI